MTTEKWIRVAAVAGLLVSSAATAQPVQSTAARECPATAARVYVTTAGVVTLDGKQVEPGDVAAEIKRLPPTIDEICYSRENGRAAPHPNARMVFPTVMNSGLRVTLYTDGTFKNAVVFKAK